MIFLLWVSFVVCVLLCKTDGRRIDNSLENSLERRIERSIIKLIEFKLSKKINRMNAEILEPVQGEYSSCYPWETGIIAC